MRYDAKQGKYVSDPQPVLGPVGKAQPSTGSPSVHSGGKALAAKLAAIFAKKKGK